MDPNLPEGTSSQPTNLRAIFIVILAIGILAAAVTYAVNRGQEGGNGNGNQASNKEEIDFEPIAPQTIVYGTWNGNNALIKSYDLQSGEQGVVAQLNDKVKKVTVLDRDQLLYIYNTNEQDHGTQLAVYSIEAGVDGAVYDADEGFGIDDYVLSPDKKSVAVWEVRFQEGSSQMRGAASRVYTAKIDSPGEKNLIYDEVQQGEEPVHYPLAITNSGQVFSDRFLPNSQRGWGYGMSVSDFSGSSKQEIAEMRDGMYATQPQLSPDGRYLVFAGYSTDRGATTGENRAEQRAGANTIAIYDLQSNSKRNLSGLPTNDTYIDTRWDTKGDIIFWALGSANADTTGMYRYALASQQATKLPIEDLESEWAITTLENNVLLVGADDTDLTSIGNLGDRYAPPFTSLYILDQNNEWWDLEVESNLIQYITLVPSGFFASEDGETSVQARKKGNNNNKKNKNNKNEGNNENSGDEAATAEGEYGSECTGFDNLQLCPFYFKAQLEPKRETQQTIPACYDGLIGPECERRGYDKNSKNQAELDAYRACLRELVRPYRRAGYCVGSPLYLYGADGKHVRVTIGTDVYNAVPSYKNGYDITLRSGGKMQINGGTFDAITYDYARAIKKVVPPAKGYVVAKADVEKTLKSYAANLGLNAKETQDLVEYGQEKVVSPYVYISHFDHATSQKMLPLTFSPHPDNYLNVVFYFRLLSGTPPFTVEAPEFGKPLGRTGFTAVEVSAVVE